MVKEACEGCGCGHWKQIVRVFDLWATEGQPSYGTLRNLLAGIDPVQLSAALCTPMSEETGISVDGLRRMVVINARQMTHKSTQALDKPPATGPGVNALPGSAGQAQ